MNEISIEQLQSQLAELEKRNQQLQEENNLMALNDEYGCYTRIGFVRKVWPKIMSEVKWIVYFDVDEMGKLNEKYTHAVVNALIKSCLSLRASDYVTGQRYSGDEFFICITDNPKHNKSNPIEFCMRLIATMRQNGFSATFAIAPVISDVLEENLEPAVRLVEEAKATNNRGSISIVPGEPR